jgi:predicted tellurium resistance membrane protein TerC
MKKKTVKKLVTVMKTNRKSGITKTIITQEKVMTSKRHQKLMKEIVEQNARYKKDHKGQLTYKTKLQILIISIFGITISCTLFSILKIITIPDTTLHFIFIITGIIFLTAGSFLMLKIGTGEDYPLKKEPK